MFGTKRFLIIFESIMGSILVLDIDVYVKILTLIVAAIVGYYSIKANRAAERRSNIEAEIKQQELYRLMQETKKRDESKQKDNEQK